LLFSLVEPILHEEGMDMSRKVTEQREADVDEEVGAAAGDEVDSDGRDWECVLVSRRDRVVVL
jgi:hypothetical protein